jgi:ADP-heptose:LPS heptosyltransferase
MNVRRETVVDFLGRRAGSAQSQPAVSFGRVLQSPQKILVVPTLGAKGFPFALPSIALLRERFPGVRIHVLADHESLSLFRGHPGIDAVHVFEPSTSWKGVRQPVSAGQELARENFDLALWLDSEVDAERRVMVSLAAQTARVGRCPDGGIDPDAEGFFNCLFRFTGEELYPPLAQLALTRRVTRTESSAPARWVVEKRLAERARQLIHFWKPRKEDYLFVVDPGRAVSGGLPASKKLSMIVEVLKKTYPCRILVASEPECAEAVQTLSREIARWEPLEIPLGKFEEAIAVLAQADLLVSPNSTLFHCAWVLGTPTIGLFGQNDKAEFEPPPGGPTVVVRSTEGLEEADFLKKVDRLLTTFSSHLAPPA